MSLRAAFSKAKQIFTKVLRQRVFIVGRNPPQAKANKDQAQPHDVYQRVGETPFYFRLRRAFVQLQKSSTTRSQAARLRRNTVLRSIVCRGFTGGPGRRRGATLPIYAFLGLTLAGGNKERQFSQTVPLETCCKIVRDIFQSVDSVNYQEEDGFFPSDISSYEISSYLLGQGTSASIYAAKLRAVESTLSPTVSESVEEKESVVVTPCSLPTDDAIVETDWEMVSKDGEAGLVAALEEVDESIDVAPEMVEESKIVASDAAVLVEYPAGDGYNLALKMMFNYSVASNAVAITQAFERECLPLQACLGDGVFGDDVRWENGHRAKKKKACALTAHPNIVDMHHAFVAPTVTHDLDEARTLFPAALPMRLHYDGVGRNQTMYLVMKRYDMTLSEYCVNIGCSSRRVAMVIIAQLLEGVAHLEHHGIAHRDLKSNNILLELTEGSPRVVISDFGCCLVGEPGKLYLPYSTKYTDICGNSALMAPEVKNSISDPSAAIIYTKSDAWAVGAVAYEILGRNNPFYYRGEDTQPMDSATYSESDLPELANGGLGTVIGLLLQRDPEMRPSAQSAADMLHLLLWQPRNLTYAAWEGLSSSAVVPAAALIQQHLTQWLLALSSGLLLQRSQGRKGHGFTGCKSSPWPSDKTEYELCMTFLSRVTTAGLLRAAKHVAFSPVIV